MAESVNFKICFNWLLDKWGGFAGDKDMAHRSGTKVTVNWITPS